MPAPAQRPASSGRLLRAEEGADLGRDAPGLVFLDEVFGCLEHHGAVVEPTCRTD